MHTTRSSVTAIGAILVTCTTAVHCVAEERPLLRVADTRCEFRVAPLGIDVTRPILTWVVEPSDRAISIAAYQVHVAANRDDLAKGEKLIWNSGRIATDDPTCSIYTGPSLATGQCCYWSVRVWDVDGNSSPWSAPSSWEMGILHPGDWQAEWINDGQPLITRDEDFYRDDPAPLMRKTFDVTAPVKRARLYIAGLGLYEASINGHRIETSELDPAWTTYSKRVLYTTYDVTEQIRVGRNCIGVTLGNGWYNPLPLRMWGQLNLRRFLTVGRPQFIAHLDIEDHGGHHRRITSGSDWRTAPGPIVRNSIYLGEHYDARREVTGWDQPEFDDSAWACARSSAPPAGALRAQQQPSIVQTASFQPIARTEPQPHVFIFDFGQNLAGWVQLRANGPPGTKVTLRFGELLHPDGTLNTLTTVCGQIKKPGVGGPGAPEIAEQSDTYILKGSRDNAALETYTPRFTYHGFRYVEITGYPGTPNLAAVTAIRISSAVEPAGEFSCSNELFNRIQKMCRATFPSNLMGVQTDCPGRERFGYGDDIACACEAHLYNYDMASFYEKTIRDFADAARPNGALTLLAPWTGHSIGGFDSGGGSFADVDRNGVNAGTGPLSGVLAHPLLLQRSYQFYGDKRIVEEQFDVSRKALDFIRQHAEDNIVRVGLGDWSSVEPTDTTILDTALYYQYSKIVSHLAHVLQRDEDAAEYERLAEDIQRAFVKNFLDDTSKQRAFHTQAARACALYQGLVPADRCKQVSQDLVADVLIGHQGHLSTGIYGTKYLLDSLAEMGYPDVAYRIVNQKTFPGWGYMLEHGATTLWEVWDYSDDVYSHNHSMFGTVSAWFFSQLAGIQPDIDAVGFNKIVLRPQVVAGLTWVKAKYHSRRGDIISHWRVESDEFFWEITVPPTASAMIYFPKDFSSDNLEDKAAAAGKGIELLSDTNGLPTYRLQSGSYSFRLRRRP